MTDENRDYNFGEAARFNKDYNNLASRSGAEPLKRVIDSYKQHMERVSDFGELPVVLVYFAVRFTEIQVRARERVRREGIKPPFDEPARLLYQDEDFNQWLTSGTEDALLDEMRRIGANDLQSFIAQSKAGIRPGIEATLAFMLSDAWSAFEILAGDLWIETINLCPSTLRSKFDSQEVKLKALSDFNYDIGNKLGRFLVDNNKVTFLSLNKIQEAYEVFDRGSAQPSKHLFEPFHALDAVSQVRNCFAHRGGLIDQRSAKAVTRIAGLETCQVGERIPLTGPIVRDCITQLVNCSMGLFRFTDDWLCNHVPKKQQ